MVVMWVVMWVAMHGCDVGCYVWVAMCGKDAMYVAGVGCNVCL